MVSYSPLNGPYHFFISWDPLVPSASMRITSHGPPSCFFCMIFFVDQAFPRTSPTAFYSYTPPCSGPPPTSIFAYEHVPSLFVLRAIYPFSSSLLSLFLSKVQVILIRSFPHFFFDFLNVRSDFADICLLLFKRVPISSRHHFFGP